MADVITMKKRIDSLGELEYLDELLEYDTDELDEAIMSIADGACSIYTVDAYNWIAEEDNAMLINDAIAQLGLPSKDSNDFLYDCIVKAQYLQVQNDFYNKIEEYILAYSLRMAFDIAGDITDEQFDELKSKIDAFDNNVKLEDINEIVDELFGEEEIDEEEIDKFYRDNV